MTKIFFLFITFAKDFRIFSYHRKVAAPKRPAAAAALHARSDHAVTAALGAVEGEVFVLPTHAAREAALTELHFDVLQVERVGRREVQRARSHVGERAGHADAADGRAVVAEQERRGANGEQ